MRRLLVGLSLAILGACAIGACAAPLDDPARFSELGQGGGPGSCGDVPSTVFHKTCAQSGCHTAATKAQGLDFESPGVEYRVINVCATEGPGRLVDTQAPSSSIIFEKLSPNPPFGSRMPLGQPPLDDATMACVLAWISNQSGTPSGNCGGGSNDDDAGAGGDATSE
jgi:hypothetical protein